MVFDINKVEDRINGHNSFFDELIDLIPASHYLPKDESAIEVIENTIYIYIWI